METNKDGIYKGFVISLLVILLPLSSIGVGLLVNIEHTNSLLNEKIATSVTQQTAVLNTLPTNIIGQVNNALAQQNQQTNNQLNSIQNTLTGLNTQVQGANNKIDAQANNIATLKSSLDSANAQIATEQKQNATYQANIASLQATLNSINARLQQPYPYYPNSPYQNYPYSGITATVQSTSNYLTLGTTITGGSTFTTVFTLTGYVNLVLSNPAGYDMSSQSVYLDFQIYNGIPSLGFASVALSGGGTSWTPITIIPTELKFQYQSNLSAGQTLSLPLILTLTMSQLSAIASCPWAQSYPFTVSVQTN